MCEGGASDVCNEWRGGCAMSGGRDVGSMKFGGVCRKNVENIVNMVLPVTLHHPLSLTPPLLLTPLPLTQRTSSAQFNVDARARGGAGRTV